MFGAIEVCSSPAFGPFGTVVAVNAIDDIVHGGRLLLGDANAETLKYSLAFHASKGYGASDAAAASYASTADIGLSLTAGGTSIVGGMGNAIQKAGGYARRVGGVLTANPRLTAAGVGLGFYVGTTQSAYGGIPKPIRDAVSSLAPKRIAGLEAKVANRTATRAEWKLYSQELRKAGQSVPTGSATSNFEIHLARSSQLGAPYGGVDAWGFTSLQKGQLVYGGSPGQSAFYTDFATVKASGLNAESLFKSLQVAPHPVYGYRPGVQAYRLNQSIRIPAGQTLANPQLGTGGGNQFFIRNFGKYLDPVRQFDLN